MSRPQIVPRSPIIQTSARVTVAMLFLIAHACGAPDGGGAFEPGSALVAAGGDSLGPEGNGWPAQTDSVIEGTGRVVLSPRQGGCWSIETPVAPFSPLNLPATFQVDGLAVAFKGVITEEVSGLCAGYIGLRLESIREAHDGP